MSHEEVSHNARTSMRQRRNRDRREPLRRGAPDDGPEEGVRAHPNLAAARAEPPSEFDGLTAPAPAPPRPRAEAPRARALRHGRVIGRRARRCAATQLDLVAARVERGDRARRLHQPGRTTARRTSTPRASPCRVSDPSTAPHARSAGTSHEHLGLFAHYTGAPPTSHHYYAQARERARSPAPVPLSSGGRERARPRSSRARAFSLSLTSRARTDDRLSRLLRFAHTRRSGTPRSSAASSCSRASAAASTRPRARSSPTRSLRESHIRWRRRYAATTTTAGRRRRTRSTRTTRRSSRAARSRTARSSRTSTRRSAAIRWRRERARVAQSFFVMALRWATTTSLRAGPIIRAQRANLVIGCTVGALSRSTHGA